MPLLLQRKSLQGISLPQHRETAPTQLTMLGTAGWGRALAHGELPFRCKSHMWSKSATRPWLAGADRTEAVHQATEAQQ
jgi:hypothetical protein